MKKDITKIKHKVSHTMAAACVVLAFMAYPQFSYANVSNKEAQQAKGSVSGTILGDGQIPLIGVSVIEKGSTNGTVTDVDGKFILQVSKPNAVLYISYIGFIPIEVEASQASKTIILKEDVTGLDEIVVVGYGTQKKATLTGSISQVGGDDLKKVAAVNLTNTLAGKTAGIIANVRSGEPGEDNANILIRGIGTTGDTNPLIVVDGIASRGFSRLNQEDIESISVLKDASAAIYGARAANGVILVTTKRGKAGKVKVNYSGSYSVSQPTRIPKMLNAYQYGTYINEYDRGHGTGQVKYSEEALQKMKDGSDPINYPSTNWWDAIANDWAPRTQHSVSVSGGTDKVSFYSSLQYLWQDAIYKNSAQDYGQYQFNSNLDVKISNKVKFGFDILGRQESRKRGIYATDYLFGYLLTTNPMAAPYYPNGLPRIGYNSPTNNAAIMVSDAPGTNNSKQNIINMKPSIHADLDFITEGLYVEGYAALDFSFNNGKQLNQPYDLFKYNPQTDEYENQRSVTGAIALNSWANNSDRITLNARLGYKRTFNEAHKVDVFAAYEQMKYNYNTVSAYRTNFLSASIPQIFAGSSNPEDWGTEGSADIDARQNYFGRVNYSYKDKYLAEVTLRYDGSMNFPVGKRWGLFPGISAGWIMSEESFFQPLKSTVSFFKLKGSWGKMGNDNVGAFQHFSRYKFLEGAIMFGEKVNKALYESVKANPNITWETSKTTNIGFSSQFLDGKFGLDFDYFYSKRSNILAYRNASIPAYTGLVLPNENIGKMKNQGLEIVANYRGKFNDFSWNINGNFTYAENKVLYMDEAATVPEWQKQTGKPYGSFLVYKAKGIYQTQAEVDNSPHIEGAKPGDLIYDDTDGDKKITWNDAIRIDDNPTPKIVYGFTLGGDWKGIDINIFFQGQAKVKMLVQPTMNMMTEFFENRWIETNTAEQNAVAKWPRAFVNESYGDAFNGPASTWWLRDASFLRLKSVELGYSLPKALINKWGLENIRIYANGSNLFTLDKIKIFDPEISTNATDYQANGLTAYPLQRSMTFGLNVTF